jgi:hypothetical protein
MAIDEVSRVLEQHPLSCDQVEVRIGLSHPWLGPTMPAQLGLESGYVGTQRLDLLEKLGLCGLGLSHHATLMPS